MPVINVGNGITFSENIGDSLKKLKKKKFLHEPWATLNFALVFPAKQLFHLHFYQFNLYVPKNLRFFFFGEIPAM